MEESVRKWKLVCYTAPHRAWPVYAYPTQTVSLPMTGDDFLSPLAFLRLFLVICIYVLPTFCSIPVYTWSVQNTQLYLCIITTGSLPGNSIVPSLPIPHTHPVSYWLWHGVASSHQESPGVTSTRIISIFAHCNNISFIEWHEYE